MQADSDRLHDAVYGALRLIEDSELAQAGLARAIGLAEELLNELRRIQAGLTG